MVDTILEASQLLPRLEAHVLNAIHNGADLHSSFLSLVKEMQGKKIRGNRFELSRVRNLLAKDAEGLKLAAHPLVTSVATEIDTQLKADTPTLGTIVLEMTDGKEQRVSLVNLTAALSANGKRHR